MDLIADTSLLVGLWRRQAWAVAFAEANGRSSIGLPWVVLGEFWHGAIRAGHDANRVREFLAIGLPILDPEPVIPAYARLCATLQGDAGYRQIGQNDLWIAATALAHERPLATRDTRHFGIVPDLRLMIADAGR